MKIHAISLDAAVALTGLSRRTLWRRLAEGELQKDVLAFGAGTRLAMDGVLALAGLDLDVAERDLLIEADQGDAQAQVDMGQWFFLRGRHQTAVYWLILAAEQAHADAMQCLGQCYAAGTGVPKDEHLALMWIARAAAHGHIIARQQMAGLHGRGDGH